METTVRLLNAGGDAATRGIRSRYLRDAGFLVEEAAGEQEALGAARERLPDLIVLEAASSDLSRQLEAEAATAAIPVVDLSGIGDSEPELLAAIIRTLVRRQTERTGNVERLLNPPRTTVFEQPYGDVAELNTAGVLAEALGEGLLKQTVDHHLKLVNTCSRVFELNGDYALSRVGSGYCRLLDRASRALCETSDNSQALASGKWLCHEACLRAGRLAMDGGGPLDTECPGGIRLFAAPVLADGAAVGSVVLGYGDPPADGSELARIAAVFGVGEDTLGAHARAQELRPQVIVDIAKERVTAAAKNLGLVVERRQAEQQIGRLCRNLNDRECQFESLFSMIPVGIAIAEDPECKVIRANPALAESLGITPDQNASNSAPHAPYKVMQDGRDVPPEELPQQVAAREGREVRGDEYEVIRADGSVRYVFGSAAPLLDTDRSVRGSIGVFIDITEHKRAHEALHEASQRVKLHVENSPLAVIEWGPDFRITRWTGEAARIFGWSAEEMLGRRIDEAGLIHEEDLPDVRKLMQDMVSSRPLRSTSANRNYRKDGGIIHCEWYNSALLDASGALVSVLSLALDVTERKLAEEALRQSEGRLRAVLDALPVGVWFTDAEGEIIVSNPAAGRIWGGASYAGNRYTEYQGRRLDTGERIQREEWASSEALRTGKPVLDQVVEIECFDGTRKIINNSAVPVLDNDGLVRGAVVLNEDITDRIRAEAELRKSESRLARAHRMASLGNWEWDPVSGELEWSDEVYAIFGLNKGQVRLTEEIFYDCVEAEDREACRAAMDETLRGGKPYDLDHRVILPDGTERVVREHAEVTRDEAGRIARVIGTVQDVTEYRRLEAQFREAQKLESVGRLAGGVAHDFNNLLTVIVGYSDLVLTTLEEAHPVWANVAEIRKAGERASSLTRQLLAFSRRQVVQPRVVDLNAILKEAGKMLKRMVGEDISVSTLLEADLWPVMADPGLIQQVLMNLVVNARDAMPNGGKLLIETKNVDLPEDLAAQHHGMKAGSHVLLAVSDTGMGMDEAVKARIFEPFFTTKPQGAGTGLGLSTCHGIVNQSGGWIGVYSEPDRGTTFKIYLPRTSESVPALVRPREKAEVPGGTGTILVVEDQQEVRRFTCDVLRRYGYKVLAAESGGEALGILSQYEQPIDLIITDLVMPGMTGRELADEIAASHPGVPTLFMSGYSDEIATRQGVLAQDAAYLQKPFAPSALADKVNEVLHGGPRN